MNNKMINFHNNYSNIHNIFLYTLFNDIKSLIILTNILFTCNASIYINTHILILIKFLNMERCMQRIE
jgi:hypothetical protein